MDRNDIVARLKQDCERTKSFFDRSSEQWLNGIITGKKETGDELEDDRLFEILCYFELLRYLKRKCVNIRYIKGQGGNGHRIPYGAAKKENFLFFRLRHGGKIYDLCSGTNIDEDKRYVEEADNEIIHPDISLQQKDDESYAPGILIAMWDAKYHEMKNDLPSMLEKGDLTQMQYWCSIFEDTLMDFDSNDILITIMPKEFSVNSVITNASKVRYSRNEMLKHKFSMVCNFNGNLDTKEPYPKRIDHINFHLNP